MAYGNHLVLDCLSDREGVVMGIIKQIMGLPVLIAMWLFAQFVKLRLWMKGY